MDNIFQGDIVRLVSDEPKVFAEALSRWGRDSEYLRLLDDEPARFWSAQKFKEWMEKDMAKDPPGEYFFQIHALDGDRLIGFIGLFDLFMHHGDAWVGIGIGERTDWGKGYGTDAMRLLLRFAFDELNLHRVTLGMFEYNPRAFRSYIKAGFQVEGHERKHLNRDGRRWDVIYMGILRSEWELQRTAARE